MTVKYFSFLLVNQTLKFSLKFSSFQILWRSSWTSISYHTYMEKGQSMKSCGFVSSLDLPQGHQPRPIFNLHCKESQVSVLFIKTNHRKRIHLDGAFTLDIFFYHQASSSTSIYSRNKLFFFVEKEPLDWSIAHVSVSALTHEFDMCLLQLHQEKYPSITYLLI